MEWKAWSGFGTVEPQPTGPRECIFVTASWPRRRWRRRVDLPCDPEPNEQISLAGKCLNTVTYAFFQDA